MNVAVLHRYPPNQAIGTNASFVEFLEQLSSKGHQVFYITFKDENGEKKIKGVTYITLPFYFNRGNVLDKKIKTWLWILLVPFFTKFFNLKYRFDIVYCDDSVPIYGFFTKVLNPRSKVIVRLGDLQTGYTLADNHKTLFKISQLFEVSMWKTMDGLVAISQPFKDYLIKQGVSGKKIPVVEESINLQEKITKRSHKSTMTTFLFHGALLQCKGLETLIDAYAITKEKFSDIRLIIAGGGDQDQKIRQLVKDRNIIDVEFTGWYNHEKLNEILAKSDIGVVMRSGNMANNFVVTTCLLENWSYQKPIIAPNLLAFAGNVNDGVNGVLFRPDDSLDLAKKMEFLLKNKSIWSQLGKNGWKTAKEKFDHKHIASKMIRSITSIYYNLNA